MRPRSVICCIALSPIGKGLDFGNTWGSGRLPIDTELPDTIPDEEWYIGRSLGAAAMNYDV